jgi:hypothetical protein
MNRPKPPTITKADLIEQAVDAAAAKWPAQPDAAMRHILNYFTSLDLVGIVDELRKGAKK